MSGEVKAAIIGAVIAGVFTLAAAFVPQVREIPTVVAGWVGRPARPAVASHVYVAGFLSNNKPNEIVPAYWKDGNLRRLPLGRSTNTYGLVNDVAADRSGNVYFVGSIGSSESSAVPCYWQGETLKTLPLPQGSTAGAAYAVTVDSSGTVLIAGRVLDSTSSQQLVCWKKDVPSVLPSSQGRKNDSWIGLAVDHAGAVYVSGDVSSDGRLTSFYWRDGGIANLDEAGLPPPVSTNGIAVDRDGSVYVAGNAGPASANHFLQAPFYWRNRTSVTRLTEGLSKGDAYAIKTDGEGNLYILGNAAFSATSVGPTAAVPVYWKNDGLHPLALLSPDEQGSANDVAVDPAGNVYVSGSILGGAVYWKNDSRFALGAGSYGFGQATGIAITY